MPDTRLSPKITLMEKIQPQQAMEILRKHGTEVTIQQAEEILEFLKMLAEIQIAQWSRQDKSPERAIEKL